MPRKKYQTEEERLEARRERSRRYYQRTKDNLTEEQKEKRREASKAWHKRNPHQQKQYRASGKHRLSADKNIEENKLTYRLTERTRLYAKEQGWDTSEITTEKIREHIGMAEWQLRVYLGYDEQAYGGQALHKLTLDHIIPCRTATDVESLLKLNHYSNLQLISRAANSRKK